MSNGNTGKTNILNMMRKFWLCDGYIWCSERCKYGIDNTKIPNTAL
jgi:succinate dehydrogenase/fumarate reductase-like Fe-S protein